MSKEKVKSKPSKSSSSLSDSPRRFSLKKRSKKKYETIDYSKMSKELLNGPPISSDKWCDSPLMICVSPQHSSYLSTNYDDQTAIPINTIFDFESKAFVGKCIIRMIDLPNTDKKYFENRRRKMDCTIQGMFKKRVRFDRTYSGQIFSQPFRNIPSTTLVAAGLKIIKALAPAMKAEVVDVKEPHLITPWVSACQTFNISLPNDVRPLPMEPIENLELLDPKLKGKTFTQRKHLFNDPKITSKYYFEPNKYVYTMSFYSHMLSPRSYNLHLGGMRWGIQQYIQSPIQINALIIPDDKDELTDSTDQLIDSAKINKALEKEIMKQANNNSNDEKDINNINNNNETNQQIINDLLNKESNNDNNNINNNDDPPNNNDSNNITDNNNHSNNDNNNNNANNNSNNELDDAKVEQTDIHNNNEPPNNSNNSNNINHINNNNNNNTTDTDTNNTNTDDTSDEFSLLKCEMIMNFHVWHLKLVDELFNTSFVNGNNAKKSGMSLSSFFGISGTNSSSQSNDTSNANNSKNSNNSNNTSSHDNDTGKKKNIFGIFKK